MFEAAFAVLPSHPKPPQLTAFNSGFFGKGDMQKEFEEAAFTLQPGEISPIVETASGLHLIERCVVSPLFRKRKFSHSRLPAFQWTLAENGICYPLHALC